MLPILFAAQSQTFEAYRNTALTDKEANDAVIRCYDAGALNVTDIPKTLREWREPQHQEMVEGGKTAWRLFNAVTEAIKGDLWRLPARTGALHRVLDQSCGLVPELNEETAVVA
jgi:hypothetical protein